MEFVPFLVKFSSAATYNPTFLKDLYLKKRFYVLFDKWYLEHPKFQKWTLENIYFMTRQKNNAGNTSFEEFKD